MQPVRRGLSDEPPLLLVQPARPRWLFALALVGLCLLVYVPGFFTIPPVDRDESRFAQASRQMFESVALPSEHRDLRLHSGGLLIPMVQDRPRLNKPPLIYWLQALAAAAFTAGDPLRDAIWMYRIPSLLAAMGSVFLTWRLGASMFGESVGRLAAALIAVCPILAWESHQARADMVLLAATTGCMGAMWALYSQEKLLPNEQDVSALAPRPSRLAPLAFWLFLSAGIMTKGPITPMIAIVSALSLGLLTGKWRWLFNLKPLLGLLIVAACVAPWVYSVGAKIGWDHYLSTIADETIGRSVSAKEGHWGPPGYHLVLLPVLLWPGSLLTAAGVVLAWRRAQAPNRTSSSLDVDPPAPAPQRGLPGRLVASLPSLPSPDLFCLAWILPTWIIFELITTKLPHYTLPLYPPLAILSARAVLAAGTHLLPTFGPNSNRLGVRVWAAIGLVLALGVAAFLGLYTYRFTDLWLREGTLFLLAPALALVLLTLLALTGLFFLRAAFLSARAGNWRRAQRRGIITATIVFALGLHAIAPVTAPGTLTEPLAAGITQEAAWASRPIASVYHEDSLIFHLRGRVERIDPSQAESWFDSNPRGIVILRPGSPLFARPDIIVISTMPGSRLFESKPRYYALRRVEPVRPSP